MDNKKLRTALFLHIVLVVLGAGDLDNQCADLADILRRKYGVEQG